MSHRRGKEIYDAIEMNDIERLNTLLDTPDAYMYYENPRNGRMTGMDLACSFGRFEIVKLLRKKGYDLNRKNDEGSTPIFYSLFCENDRNYKILVYLILNGADVNIQDSNHLTLIHLCIMHKMNKALFILLDNGANINVGLTMEITIAQNNYKDVFPLFLMSNYWVFNRLRIPMQEIDEIRIKTLINAKLISNVIDCLYDTECSIDKSKISSDIDMFKKIIECESKKDKFINRIFNFGTYKICIEYNLNMIELIKIAISHATEKMIVACIEAVSCKRSKQKRIKEYVAIRIIGKVGELQEKQKYYEKQYTRVIEILKKKKKTIAQIAYVADTKCKELMA